MARVPAELHDGQIDRHTHARYMSPDPSHRVFPVTCWQVKWRNLLVAVKTSHLTTSPARWKWLIPHLPFPVSHSPYVFWILCSINFVNRQSMWGMTWTKSGPLAINIAIWVYRVSTWENIRGHYSHGYSHVLTLQCKSDDTCRYKVVSVSRALWSLNFHIMVTYMYTWIRISNLNIARVEHGLYCVI